jgi:translation initiation factor 2 subunit 3
MSSLKLSDIIKGQAIFNCGTAGHVSHGKSTLVYALTGTQTQRFEKERERNITIRLGYANCKLCLDPSTGEVKALPSSSAVDKGLVHLSTISFVDCPGHELYMATMISGSKVMDYAMVVLAANETIPKPQTHRHLIALDYSRIGDISFALNKLDLVKKEDVPKVKERLDEYLKYMGMQDKVIHPISAATGGNLKELCKFLAAKVNGRIPLTIEAAKKPLRMNIVRSYNVNRPNTKLEDLKGAVVGGSIESGVLSVGDQVELRPGIIYNKPDASGKSRRVIQPLVGRVTSLESDHNALTHAIPGGLIGVNLTIYAGLSHNDALKGFVLGHVGTLPDMYDRILGKFRTIDSSLPGSKEKDDVVFASGQTVDVVVNGICIVQGKIAELKTKKGESKKGSMTLELQRPVAMNMDDSIAIMIDNKLVAAFLPGSRYL